MKYFEKLINFRIFPTNRHGNQKIYVFFNQAWLLKCEETLDNLMIYYPRWITVFVAASNINKLRTVLISFPLNSQFTHSKLIQLYHLLILVLSEFFSTNQFFLRSIKLIEYSFQMPSLPSNLSWVIDRLQQS